MEIINTVDIKTAAMRAAEVLKLGGVIIYPTDTIYGLGANILDLSAVERVFDIKGRDLSKPVSILFKDISQAKRFAVFNDAAEKLAKKFLPGALTLIVNAKTELHSFLGGQKIGVRIIDHPVTSAILNEVDFPITSTSANLTGGENPLSLDIAVKQLQNNADLALDCGKCKHCIPSTVVDVSSGKIKIIREGAINANSLITSL